MVTQSLLTDQLISSLIIPVHSFGTPIDHLNIFLQRINLLCNYNFISSYIRMYCSINKKYSKYIRYFIEELEIYLLFYGNFYC